MSAPFTASAVSFTVNPASSAADQDLEPFLSPTVTSNPPSFKFSEWACPCEPYPKTVIFLPSNLLKSQSAS